MAASLAVSSSTPYAKVTHTQPDTQTPHGTTAKAELFSQTAVARNEL